MLLQNESKVFLCLRRHAMIKISTLTSAFSTFLPPVLCCGVSK